MVERIRNVKSFQELGEEIRRVEFSNLRTQEILVAVRKLEKISKPAPSVRIALLGTHTFQPLPNYLSVRAAASQKTIECWCGPYGQYMQPLSPPAPELTDLKPDIVLLSAQMRSIAPRVVEDFASFIEEDAQKEMRRILDHLLQWAELAAEITNATVLVANFPRPRYPQFGIADAKRIPSERDFYTRLNLDLSDALRLRNRFGVLDLDSVVSGHGAEASWTRRAYYLSKQPWQPGLCNAIAREIWRHVIATKGWARKCLVLDLDNTLWGGVAGEDGPLGIRVGAGEPEGEAFADFQRAIRSLKSRGVLLAVASKNNRDDVAAVFEQRPEMPLKLEDFAIMEVGWESKVQALENIADALNIGLDSLVFLDDSPVERLLVRGALPVVVTPEMPEDPGHFASFLKRQAWFERPVVTTDDSNKAQQYKDQAERAVRRRSARDVEHYLAELETIVEIRHARKQDVPRLHQLFAKTNQFNVTTRRYNVGEIESFIRSKQHVLCVASARDRFGDLGQIGLYLLETSRPAFRIDSFLLSCRAMGRGIETVMMNYLKREVLQHGKDGSLLAQFTPTTKNSPASGFFPAQGFRAGSTADTGVVEYVATLATLHEIDVPHIRAIDRDARKRPRHD